MRKNPTGSVHRTKQGSPWQWFLPSCSFKPQRLVGVNTLIWQWEIFQGETFWRVGHDYCKPHSCHAISVRADQHAQQGTSCQETMSQVPPKDIEIQEAQKKLGALRESRLGWFKEVQLSLLKLEKQRPGCYSLERHSYFIGVVRKLTWALVYRM